MFEHLDGPESVEPTPRARDKVRARVARRARLRRRRRFGIAGLAALIVAAAIGVPAGLGAFTSKPKVDLTTTDRGTASPTPSTVAPPTSTLKGPPPMPPETTVSHGGPALQSVSSLVVAPDGEAWALGQDGRGWAVDRSVDAGETWERIGNLSLATSTSDHLQLRAAAGGGLWIFDAAVDKSIVAMTADDGRHWTTPAGSPGHVVDLQAVGESVWALTDPCPSSSGSCTEVLMTSPDGGQTWATPSSQPVTGSGALSSLSPPGPALARVGPDSAWVFTRMASPAVAASGGTAASYVVSWMIDGGVSWRTSGPISAGMPLNSWMIGGGDPLTCGQADLAVGATGAPWFLCTGQGTAGNMGRAILRSPDGGATWTVVQQGVDPGYPSEIIAFDATHALLPLSRAPTERTVDGGRTWSPINLPTYQGDYTNLSVVCDRNAACLAATTMPESSSRLNVWRTSDGGTTWTAPVQLP